MLRHRQFLGLMALPVYALVSLTHCGGFPTAPLIKGQPADQSVSAGESATFTVSIYAIPDANLQWERDGKAIPGATQASYTLNNASNADHGSKFTVVAINTLGKIRSREALLTVKSASPNDPQTAPVFKTQPLDLSISEGGQATFTVSVLANPEAKLQWERNGQPIAGATQASYTLGKVSSADHGAKFAVAASNSLGKIRSREALLTVKAAVPSDAPVITKQPEDLNVTEGGCITFHVEASGPDLTYQWRRAGTPVPDATSPDFMQHGSKMSDDGATFDVQVTNGSGSVLSNTVKLHVTPRPDAAPEIYTHPENQAASVGASATFSVSADGYPEPTYQWRKNGNPVSGASGMEFTLNNIQPNDDGAKIDVVVENRAGRVVSDPAVLTVNGAYSAPVISLQPQDQRVKAGEGAQFSVKATGNPAPSFQWLKNGQPISGQTQPILRLENVQAADDGARFSAKVTNTAGTVLSSEASLRVIEEETGFTVTFVAGPGGTLQGELTQKVAQGGSTRPVIASPASGKLFNFWTGVGTSVIREKELIIPSVTSNLTVTAHFASSGKATEGSLAPNIAGIDSTGAVAALSDYFGKVVILGVSGQWCGICNQEAPSYEALHQKVKGKGIVCVQVLAESSTYKVCTQADLQAWVKKHGMTLRIQSDASGASSGTAKRCYVGAAGGYPAFVVLDKTFKIRSISHSMSTAESVATQILSE